MVRFLTLFQFTCTVFSLIQSSIVGGEILDMALGRAKPHARFVMCGGMSYSYIDFVSEGGF